MVLDSAAVILPTLGQRRATPRPLALGRAPACARSHYVVEMMFMRHPEGMTGGRDHTGWEGVTDTYPMCTMLGLMKLSRRNVAEPYLGVWPMMADQCGRQCNPRCAISVLQATALALASASASNVKCVMRKAMTIARVGKWFVFILSAAVLTTTGDAISLSPSGGAYVANRQCLARSRGRGWRLRGELPMVTRWCRRSRTPRAGQIRCMACTPRTVVARRDHLPPRFTVLLAMIVAGTSFRGQFTVATTFADWDRHSMALGGRTLFADEVDHLSSVGRAS